MKKTFKVLAFAFVISIISIQSGASAYNMLVFNCTLLATKQPTYEGTLTKTDTSRQVIKITNAYDG